MQNTLALIVGINTFLYGLLAYAYWTDAVRYARRLVEVRGSGEEEYVRKNRKSAEVLFRLCTSILAISLILALLPIFFSSIDQYFWYKIVSVILTLILVIMCFRYALGYYFVQIDESK